MSAQPFSDDKLQEAFNLDLLTIDKMLDEGVRQQRGESENAFQQRLQDWNERDRELYEFVKDWKLKFYMNSRLENGRVIFSTNFQPPSQDPYVSSQIVRNERALLNGNPEIIENANTYKNAKDYSPWYRGLGSMGSGSETAFGFLIVAATAIVVSPVIIGSAILKTAFIGAVAGAIGVSAPALLGLAIAILAVTLIAVIAAVVASNTQDKMKMQEKDSYASLRTATYNANNERDYSLQNAREFQAGQQNLTEDYRHAEEHAAESYQHEHETISDPLVTAPAVIHMATTNQHRREEGDKGPYLSAKFADENKNDFAKFKEDFEQNPIPGIKISRTDTIQTSGREMIPNMEMISQAVKERGIKLDITVNARNMDKEEAREHLRSVLQKASPEMRKKITGVNYQGESGRAHLSKEEIDQIKSEVSKRSPRSPMGNA